MNKITKISISMGDIINRLMEIRSINDKQLESRSGISAKLINLIKTNQYERIHRLKFSTARAIATALDIPPHLLIKAPYIIEKEKEEK